MSFSVAKRQSVAPVCPACLSSEAVDARFILPHFTFTEEALRGSFLFRFESVPLSGRSDVEKCKQIGHANKYRRTYCRLPKLYMYVHLTQLRFLP